MAQLAGQGTALPGEAFASGCAGLVFGYTPVYAGDVVAGGISVPGTPCATAGPRAAPAVAIAASAAGVSNGTAFNAQGRAQARAGTILLQGHVQASTGTASAGSVVQGGWNERFTLSAPGQSGQALWVVPIAANGQLKVGGSGGLAYVDLTAFAHHAPISGTGNTPNGQAMAQFAALQPSHQGVDHGGWDDQMLEWAVADAGPGLPNTLDSLALSGTVRFVVPFTWDQPLDLGIWAMGSVGQSSQGAPTTVGDSADILPGTGFHWAGPGVVLSGGQTITQFGLSAASGLNYLQPITPAVPEPGAALLMALGLAAGWAARRAAGGWRRTLCTRHGPRRRGVPWPTALALAGMATLAAPAQAQLQNLVANGSFEDQSIIDNRIFPAQPVAYFDWYGRMTVVKAKDLPFGPAPDGQRVAFWSPILSHEPMAAALMQDIPTTPGHHYWVSFNLATSVPYPEPGSQYYNTAHLVTASFGQTPFVNTILTNQGFTRYAKQIVATQALTTLRIADPMEDFIPYARYTPETRLAIDDVQVTDTGLSDHPSAEATPHRWDLGPGHTDHFYLLNLAPQGIRWADAAAAAQALGGTLAQGGSAAALSFLGSVATDDTRTWAADGSGPTHGPWLGLHQQLNYDATAGQFLQREAASDALAYGYVVEWASAPVPEPGLAALWLCGLATLWPAARRQRPTPITQGEAA